MPLKENTRVLVTAAGSGIGRVIAETFHQHGARVHICDIDQKLIDDTASALSGVTGTLCDVSVPEQVARLFEDVTTQLGGLDVLVNNAGIAGPTELVENLEIDDWNRTLAVNLSGQFYCARLAIPMIREAGGGSIINLASIAGRKGYPFRTPYAASKWGVVGLTKSLSRELGAAKIRVNAILPGIVEGPRIERVFEARAKTEGRTRDEIQREFLAQTSMGEFISPQSVANTALFLASEEGQQMSGQTLNVDGDQHVLG